MMNSKCPGFAVNAVGPVNNNHITPMRLTAGGYLAVSDEVDNFTILAGGQHFRGASLEKRQV